MKRAALLVLSGCIGPPVMIAGMSLDRLQWERDVGQVRERAASELNCPAERVTVIPVALLGSNPDETQNRAALIGAKGCGHRLVYGRSPFSGWVLDSSDGAPK